MSNRKEFALIVKICKMMDDQGLILSKISLQQLIYILQKIYFISSDYQFQLFTYGPYSVDLISDLDYLFSQDVLKIEYSQGPEYYGSSINLAENYQDVLRPNIEYIHKIQDKIKKVIELFGRKKTRELELIGTIIFLNSNTGKTNTDILERIMLIKPYFKESEIQQAVDELNEKIYK